MLKPLFIKDFKELIRTKKVLVLPFIFIVMGIISPLFAMYTKEIIASIDPSLQNLIPDPTVNDAYMQLYKNYNQLGLFILIFLTTSSLMDEKVRGTIILLISKPINKINIVLSKLIINLFMVILSLGLSSLFFVFYTYVLFEKFDFYGYIISISIFTLFCIFLVSLALLFSTILNSYVAASISTLVAFIVLSSINMLGTDYLAFLPTRLLDYTTIIFSNPSDLNNLYISVGATIILTIVNIISTIFIFRRQEI